MFIVRREWDVIYDVKDNSTLTYKANKLKYNHLMGEMNLQSILQTTPWA